ncbi:MAG: apolipoprotein N-acyltransferase [Cyanobacteriota bacterium]|nr:apolipoprotein N-acyltransferase [Cyanobacteriota bacterium]
MGNDRLSRLALAAGAGAVAGLALPPLGWPWLLWPSLAVLWSQVGAGRGGLAALVWGFFAVLVSHRWLPALHPLDWVGVPSPLSLPLCLLLWSLCALLGGGLVAAWALLARRLDPARASTALLASAGWGLAEVLLAKGPLFWIGLGAAPLPGDPWLAGLAVGVGAGGLAALQVGVGWGLWRWCVAWRAATPVAARARRGGALLLVGGLLAAHGAGAAALGPGGEARAAALPPPGSAETVLVVQPAVPTRQKFQPWQQARLGRMLAAALVEAEPRGATVVLPEGTLLENQPLPRAAPVEVLSGGFRRADSELRSALLRFAPRATIASGWVDKHRVVPLGEWVPLGPLLRWSGLSAVGGLEPGEPSRLLNRPVGPIGVAICYEIADGRGLAEASRAGARWLLASANLDPYPLALQRQFQVLARLRAMESGRWLVSAANTGPSLLVDPAGRVRAALPSGEARTGFFVVPPSARRTPYLLAGERTLMLAGVAGLALRGARR